MFCISLFSFDIRILITPLVSSNSFYVLVTYVFIIFDAGKRFLFFSVSCIFLDISVLESSSPLIT